MPTGHWDKDPNQLTVNPWSIKEVKKDLGVRLIGSEQMYADHLQSLSGYFTGKIIGFVHRQVVSKFLSLLSDKSPPFFFFDISI